MRKKPMFLGWTTPGWHIHGQGDPAGGEEERRQKLCPRNGFLRRAISVRREKNLMSSVL